MSVADLHPIQDTEEYVAWANTLDSTGQDSSAARERFFHPRVIQLFITCCLNAINAGDNMDDLKKYVFYGKQKGLLEGMNLEVPADPTMEFAMCERVRGFLDNHEKIRLFHAICGWITEGGELVKEFYEALEQDRPINVQNIKEESGDGMWYQALIAKWLGFTGLGPILQGNYNKLVKRYGTKWSQDAAVNRDIPAELSAMDGVEWDSKAHAVPLADIQTLKPTYEFDPEGQYNDLKSIVAQLEFVGYRDETGHHDLVNNAAFVSLKAMSEGKKPVAQGKYAEVILTSPTNVITNYKDQTGMCKDDRTIILSVNTGEMVGG